MNPVVHFEFPYDDAARIQRFYRAAFGWETQALGPGMGNYVVCTTSKPGFDVKAPPSAARGAINGGFYERKADWPAQHPSVVIAVDDIRAAMEGLLPTTKIEKALGAAEVRKVFKITKVGTIAGCYVTSGVVKRGADARLVRDGIVVYTGKIATLRRIKDDVKEVAEGTECGIGLENYQDIKESDIVEAFEIEEVKQKLA